MNPKHACTNVCSQTLFYEGGKLFVTVLLNWIDMLRDTMQRETRAKEDFLLIQKLQYDMMTKIIDGRT